MYGMSGREFTVVVWKFYCMWEPAYFSHIPYYMYVQYVSAPFSTRQVPYKQM